jgi:hypothetical protein
MLFRHASGQSHAYGAHGNMYSFRGHGGKTGLRHHRFDRFVIRKHGEHNIRVDQGFVRACVDGGSERRQRRALLRVSVVHAQGQSGLSDSPCHVPAHAAQADKRCFHDVLPV